MSSSRRSSSRRTTTKRSAPIPTSTRKGLQSLVNNNESYIQSILSLKPSSSSNNNNTQQELTDELEKVMSTNNLSAELLLARFFDKSVLSKYCVDVLSKSGKGGAATLAERIVREWSKKSFDNHHDDDDDDNLTFSKKHKKDPDDNTRNDNDYKEEDDDDDDWRKPLFFWKGTLTYKSKKLVFKGSWVSALAKDGVPSVEDYQSTFETNSFQLFLQQNNGDKSMLQSLLGLSGSFQGSYLLDQGDGCGPQTFSDLTHKFEFSSLLQQQDDQHASKSENKEEDENCCVVIGASGSTDFGNFVSFGYAKPIVTSTNETATTTTSSSKENEEKKITTKVELILARRYVDEKDIRHSWYKDPSKMLNYWNSRQEQHKGLNFFCPESSSKDLWNVVLPWKMMT